MNPDRRPRWEGEVGVGPGGAVKIKRACLGLFPVRPQVPRLSRGSNAEIEIVDLLGKDKPPVISKPYDPVHVTHVGFDFQTGKCASRRFLYCCVLLTHDGTQKDTGMPPKWQQVLDDNGITQDEQERNPNGVMAVVQYLKHQDEGEDEEEEIWAKMKNAQPPALPAPPSAASSQPTTPGAGVMGSREMSRETSNEALGPAGGQVVGDFTSPRMAPAPPTKPSLNRMLVCFSFFFFSFRFGY